MTIYCGVCNKTVEASFSACSREVNVYCTATYDGDGNLISGEDEDDVIFNQFGNCKYMFYTTHCNVKNYYNGYTEDDFSSINVLHKP
jgi:hypothetical protein